MMMANPLAALVATIAAGPVPELLFLVVLISPAIIFASVPLWDKVEVHLQQRRGY